MTDEQIPRSLCGTYRLVSSKRKILATGEIVDTYGKSPTGYIMYGADGRMLALIVFDNRVKPESIASISPDQRALLFGSMLAYGGTYELKGDRVEHHLDISWNEVWTGTTLVRYVKRDGDRLVLTTHPGPFSSDGEMSEIMLVWEKLHANQGGIDDHVQTS